MTDPVSRAPNPQISAAIQRGAAATGVDFSLLVETARRESSFDASARAGTSSATGLFQFVDSTWLDMVRRHGAAHGLEREAAALSNGHVDSETRSNILALRNNPEIAARMAGELVRENASTLERTLGRAPNAGELYAAHVLGAGGAANLIQAAERGAGDASALFPQEARANRGLFYTSGGEPRSAQGLLSRLSLDADASIGAPRDSAVGDQGSISPALAHALFEMALLPLLRGDGADNADEQNPEQALLGRLAYARASGV